MSFEQDAYSRDAAYRHAQERAQVPAIFLIIVGLINLVAAGFLLLAAYRVSQLPPDQFRQLLTQSAELQQALRQLEDQGWPPERLQQFGVTIYATWGGIALPAALITLLGGVRMMSLKSYGIAMTGSFLAAIPFV